MGTRLIARGLDLSREDPALGNLSHPREVWDIHRRDVEAGADGVLTNTFGANAPNLARYGQGHQVASVIRTAVTLAREAGGRLVIGSIGPSAVHQPEAYREQAGLLAAAGVDALILETHSHEEALDGLGRLRGFTGVPILVSLVDDRPLDVDTALRMNQWGASALGWNCLVGMEPMLRMAESLGRAGFGIPLIVKPSAGLPGKPPATPESFAEAVPALLELGVRLFGGCCGTTEAHVAAVRAALDARSRA
jgi:methionine synthase I (cobalamin-dependent)